MKDPWDWDEADINQLIQGPVQESVSLDYKACASLDSSDVKKNEVSKDVSAFANSAGGTIVYGVIEQGNVPTGIDSGYDPAIISREWLEQVINTRIQRRIDGVRIKQVLLTGQRTGKVLYVVSVPQNMGFPYQASDKRFYKRFNFQSVPMEVYEIQDVARRAEVPDLQISLNFSSGKSTSLAFPGAEHWSSEVRLTAELENANPAPAEYIWLTLYVASHVPSSGVTMVVLVSEDPAHAETASGTSPIPSRILVISSMKALVCGLRSRSS